MILSKLFFLSQLQIWPTLAILITILATLASKHLIRPWRGLFALTILHLAQNIAMAYYSNGAPTSARYAVYFWTYWPACALSAIATVVLLRDLLHSVPLHDCIPKPLIKGLLAFAVTASTIYAVVGILANPRHKMFRTTTIVMSMDYSLAGMLAIFTVTFIFGVAITGLAFTRRSLRILLTLAVQLLLRLAMTFAVLHRTHNANQIALAYDVSCTLAYATWLYSLIRAEDPYPRTAANNARIDELLTTHVAEASQL